MGIGIGLGGVATGLESAERTRLAEQDQGLRQQALGLQERSLERQEQNSLISQASSHLSNEIGLVTSVIESGKQGGQSSEKIAQTVSTLMPSIERLAGVAGRDPASIRAQIDALIQTPATADPANRERELKVKKLEREAANETIELDDAIVSIDAAIEGLDTLESINGAEGLLLLPPERITQLRQGLAASQLDPIGIIANLGAKFAGVDPKSLATALDAAETVNKQRSALLSLSKSSNQAGVRGLAAQEQGLGLRAGLKVQRGVFGQTRERVAKMREQFDVGEPDTVPDSTGPLPLPGTKAELVKGQVYDLADGRQALWTGKELELLN